MAKTKLTKLEKKLKEFSRFLEEDLRENLILNDFTGELSKSIKVELNVKKMSINLSFLEYGLYLDTGTKPHWTSVRNLQTWANAKGINVYALQASIAKKGTKAHPWLYKWGDAKFDKKLKKMIGQGVKADLDQWRKTLKTN